MLLKFVWTLACSLILSSSVCAEDIYQDVVTCDAYFQYLSGREVAEFEGCDRTTSYLIEMRGEDVSRTALSYLEAVEGETPFKNLLLSISAMIWERKSEAFYGFDVGSTQLFSTFYVNGDVERAVVYSFLSDGVKLEIMKEELRDGSNLLSFYENRKLADLIGKEFELFDNANPDYSLLCVLKYDNVRVPFSTVVKSTALKDCIEMKK